MAKTQDNEVNRDITGMLPHGGRDITDRLPPNIIKALFEAYQIDGNSCGVLITIPCNNPNKITTEKLRNGDLIVSIPCKNHNKITAVMDLKTGTITIVEPDNVTDNSADKNPSNNSNNVTTSSIDKLVDLDADHLANSFEDLRIGTF